jgi:hypothetical protein
MGDIAQSTLVLGAVTHEETHPNRFKRGARIAGALDGGCWFVRRENHRMSGRGERR